MKKRGTVYFNKHVNETQTKTDIKKVISKWMDLCAIQSPPLGIFIIIIVTLFLLLIIN